MSTQHSIPQPDKAFLPTSSSPSRCTQHASVTPQKHSTCVPISYSFQRAERVGVECPIWRRSQEIKVTRQRHHPSPVCDVPNLVRQSGTSTGGYQKHSKQQIRAGVSPGGAVRSRIRWGQEAGLELQHKSERYNQKTGC